MEIKVTKRQAAILLTLHKHGESTISAIAVDMGCTDNAALSGVRKIQKATSDKLVVEGEIPGAKIREPRITFDLSPALRAMSFEELQQAIGAKNAEKRKRIAPAESKLHISLANEALKDKQNEEFLQVNCAYLPAQKIADCLGLKINTLQAMASIKGISLSEKDHEPRAADIAQAMGYIPVGTEIEQWQRGTCFHLPSQIAGINRVTRHFAADDE